MATLYECDRCKTLQRTSLIRLHIDQEQLDDDPISRSALKLRSDAEICNECLHALNTWWTLPIDIALPIKTEDIPF